MKNDQLVAYKAAAPMNDFQYLLERPGARAGTAAGGALHLLRRGPRFLGRLCRQRHTPSRLSGTSQAARLRAAFADLPLNQTCSTGSARRSFRPRPVSVRLARQRQDQHRRRVTRAFGQDIWIPRAMGIDGEIIRLFDPGNHEELPLEGVRPVYDGGRSTSLGPHSPPTIVVGGD